MMPISRRRRLVIGTALVAALAMYVRMGPLPPNLLDARDDTSTVVVDRHGTPLYEARSSSGTRAMRLMAADMPRALVDATLAAEDRRFYHHPGVDPLALVRAALRNVRAWRAVEGGSTITQQVAKLLLDARARRPRPRGLAAKIHETLTALRLEHRLSKNEILALYLSLAPYGNQVVGAARASEVYFGVPPSLLTLGQSAFLAGLPQRPSTFNPYRHAARAVARQRAILDRMVADRWTTADQAREARAERLRFQPNRSAFVAPHFVEMVLAAHRESRRARIDTTLDARLQADVAGILRAQQPELVRHGARNVAVVVLDNRLGEWLAWEGSGDYFDGEHGGAIDGALAPRQPGSALKPFTYVLGFERGDTPATVLPDVAASFPTAQPGVVYTPRNYDGTFHGPLRIRKALAGSQNVPAVQLASRAGVPDVLRFLKALGFSTLDRNAAHYGLGLTLGNAEVTLADLVAAYAALARGGVWIEPRAVRGGDARKERRVMSPRSAYWVTDVLSDADARAYVFGRGGSLEFPFTVAVKTGTSQAYRDNWTVGYTRDFTVGVWVGNFDRRPLTGSSGVAGAGPVFHAVMLAAERHVRGSAEASHDIVERPPDLVEAEICELSGMRAGEACLSRRREWLPPHASPLPCSWHHLSDEGVLTLWPDEYRHWASARGVLEETPAVRGDSMRVVRAAAPRPQPFGIVSPPDGATYLIDPTLRPEYQALSLRVAGTRGSVRWRVNGRLIGSADADRHLSWKLRSGQHHVTAHDRRGRTAQVTIRVK